jgi:type I restriction enzyme S subunit
MSPTTGVTEDRTEVGDSIEVPENGSRISSIGMIPVGWESVPLSELFEFKNGVNADKHAYGHGIAFANVLEVITHGQLRTNDIPGRISLTKAAIELYRIRYGDVLFNRTSETQDEVGLSSVYLDNDVAVFGGFVIRGRPKAESLYPIYAGYALRALVVRAQIIAKGQGAIRANIGQADLRQVHALRPSNQEQRAIAGALSDVDGLIGALEKQIAKKRAIKWAAMQQLLTGRTRLPAFQAKDGCKDTPIGMIPEQWNLRTCEELCLKIQDGTHFSPKLGGNEYRYVTSRNIGFGTLNITDTERISGVQHRKIYARCDVRKGDLLLTKDGANTGNAAINSLDEECSLLSSVAFLRFDPLLHDPRFYLQYILSARGQFRIKDLMSGNAITRLTLAKIRGFSLPVPTKEEQEAIGTVLSDMDTEIAALERRRDKTKAIKQGMMQALLTGRIRLVKPGAQK